MTAPAPAQDGLLDLILATVRQVRPGTDPQPGDTFTGLGLDSLDRVAVADAIERAGIPVSDEALSGSAGPGDLAARLHPAERTPAMAPQPPPAPPAAGWHDAGAVVGARTRLWHQAQVAAGGAVGQDCRLGKGAFVGPGAAVGDRVKIGSYACVFGARIGDEAMICPGALLLEDPAPRATTPAGLLKGAGDWTARPVTVGTGATVGAGAVIAPGVTVGARALIGIGAVVVRDVPAHALVLGNPARQVGWACRCAATLDGQLACSACGRGYRHVNGGLAESTDPPGGRPAP